MENWKIWFFAMEKLENITFCHGKHGKIWVFAMEKLENITFCHGKHGKIWVLAMENWKISLFAMENMVKNPWF